MPEPQPTPDHILQLGLGFWGSRTMLSAVELGLFTTLARVGPQSADELRAALGLHPRSARDFFDALVALGMLTRDDIGRYDNTPDTALFLDRAKPTYVGGVLEMAAARLYPFWAHLTEALRTGEHQNEARHGDDLFARIYADPQRLRQFLAAMTGISSAAAQAIAAKFDWSKRTTFADVGCAQGAVPVTLARAHPHLTGIGFDLPQVGPIFEDYAASFGLSGRLRFQAGDFTRDPMPSADVLIMGHILHDWNLDEKMNLLRKAHAALAPGGCLIVYEAIIDDARRTNAFGLLMSLNMLIETPGGFDFTGQDCQAWMREVGFSSTYVQHLAGPDSMVVGEK